MKKTVTWSKQGFPSQTEKKKPITDKKLYFRFNKIKSFAHQKTQLRKLIGKPKTWENSL